MSGPTWTQVLGLTGTLLGVGYLLATLLLYLIERHTHD